MEFSKITIKNSLVFRERHDYGPFPAGYYYLFWHGKRFHSTYGQVIASGLQPSLGAYHKGKGRAVLYSLLQWRKLEKNVLHRYIRSSKFIRRHYEKGTELGLEYLDFCRHLLANKKAISNLDSLIRAHKKWIWYYAEYSFWNVVPWLAGSDVITKHITDNLIAKGVNANEIQTLLSPVRPSYIQQEEMELLGLAKRLNISGDFTRQNIFAKKALKKHTDKWSFIPWDYIGPEVWDEKKILQRLRSIVSTQSEADSLKKQIEKRFVQLARKQHMIIQKHRLDKKIVRQITDWQTLAMMQDQKKHFCTFSQYTLHHTIYKELARKCHIKSVECSKFSEVELWQMAGGTASNIKNTLKQRLRACCSGTSKSGVFVIYGKKAEKVYHQLDTKKSGLTLLVKGQTASLGKVRGRAAVLSSPIEIGKVKKGDILIAPMTTPDYVPAMKKAAAIVTNEGGLTSHAAIVSRELRIPCVIGTKIATTVFKTGDKVEVDADKGVVRKI